MKKCDKERIGFLALMGIAAVGLYIGWKVFWFLTDDAYIAYRYVSNSIEGYGYVWNPPPFLPVEGYTSFLWVVFLDVIWRVTGLEPPVVSNFLSFLFSCATLVLVSSMFMRLDWSLSLRKLRLHFLSLFLLFLLLNRSFLMWTSSGLETAMFCFFVTLWVFVIIWPESPVKRVFGAALAASAITLTRPDGLLFCLATVILALIWVSRAQYRGKSRRLIILGLAPLLLVCLHFLWRVSFYEAWLPNTYYAKVVAPWPKSGTIYALSFILEYGFWFFIIFMACGALLLVYRWIRDWRPTEQNKTNLLRRIHDKGYDIKLLVVLILMVHFAYYTLIVGGDHFEYRVYNHLIPFIFLAFVWLLNRLRMNGMLALSFAFAFVLLSLPVQWTHWAATKDLDTLHGTREYAKRHGDFRHVPITPEWPQAFQWYARLFDRTQSWLNEHRVCIRHHVHKTFWLWQMSRYPSREEGLTISNEDYPIHAAASVGIPAWVLPNVYIIDLRGLNDYVIARIPLAKNAFRTMAHDRRPLPGYVGALNPNVFVEEKNVKVKKRQRALSDTTIRQIESYWRNHVVTLHSGDSTFSQHATKRDR